MPSVPYKTYKVNKEYKESVKSDHKLSQGEKNWIIIGAHLWAIVRTIGSFILAFIGACILGVIALGLKWLILNALKR